MEKLKCYLPLYFRALGLSCYLDVFIMVWFEKEGGENAFMAILSYTPVTLAVMGNAQIQHLAFNTFVSIS